MSKIKVILGVLIFISLMAVYLYLIIAPARNIESQNPDLYSIQEKSVHTFAPEVIHVLEQKLEPLERDIAINQVIIKNIIKSNLDNTKITEPEIMLQDARWRNSKDNDTFVASFLTNDVARELLAFQNSHKGFSEIFVTDSRGLNVGQTNKTTDYYQADEKWWQDSYNEGQGRAMFGNLEFDESSQTVAISLYVPIKDLDNRVIGVIKAVLSVNEIEKLL